MMLNYKMFRILLYYFTQAWPVLLAAQWTVFLCLMVQNVLLPF